MLIQSWVIYGFTTRRTYLVSVRFRGRQGRVYYCRLSPQLCINKMIAPLSAIFIIFRSFDYLLAQFYTASNERHLSDNSPKRNISFLLWIPFSSPFLCVPALLKLTSATLYFAKIYLDFNVPKFWPNACCSSSMHHSLLAYNAVWPISKFNTCLRTRDRTIL